MYAEDFVLDNGREREVVEDLSAVSPNIDGAILPQTLVVEPVHLGDLPRFVVAANQSDAVRIAHLGSRGEGRRVRR